MELDLTKIAYSVVVAVLCATIDVSANPPQEVDFNSAALPHTTFAIARAKKKGVELKPKVGTPLRGFLYKPNGDSRMPSVVMLHGCRGLERYQQEWAKRVSTWGYVVLLADSFGAREKTEICSEIQNHNPMTTELLFDAYGALSYLIGKDYVNKSRIAVMGWTRMSVASSVFNKGVHREFEGTFRAAVAIHPDCNRAEAGSFYAPLMIAVGEQDDWSSVAKCRSLAARLAGGSIPVTLKIYPDAFYGFDNPELPNHFWYAEAHNLTMKSTRGATLGYSRLAHQSLIRDVEVFLSETLRE